MNNNDVLRKFRYALNINDSTMLKIFKMSECQIDQPQLINIFKKEDEQDYVICGDDLMELFLDGLIIYNRGKQERATEEKRPLSWVLTNNIILKKLRIALELQQEDMFEIFKLAGVKVSKGELSALFRKPGHKNYRECKDQFLRNFLKGLALYHRK